MPKKLTLADFIAKSVAVHGSRYDYSRAVYEGTSERITIICEIHGEFEQVAMTHLVGHGCPFCRGFIRTRDRFIAKSREIHGTMYGYDNVVFTTVMVNVRITCYAHGDFSQLASSHLAGSGCPTCKGYIRTKERFIILARKTHGDIYDYDNTIFVSGQKVISVTCQKHGAFDTRISDFLRGVGCSRCRGFLRPENELIEMFRGVHGSRYDYSKITDTRTKSKIPVGCPKHGDFMILVGNHLNGAGCQKCGVERRDGPTAPHSTDTFIAKARQMHGTRYDYSQTVYARAMEKVCIICDKHGVFTQVACAHLGGKGCKQCHHVVSKGESDWLDCIGVLERQKTLRIGMPEEIIYADGYESNSKTIYEYHGDYWHGNPLMFSENAINKHTKTTFGELYRRTVAREQRLRESGYVVVVMWERTWKQQSRKKSCLKIVSDNAPWSG